MSAATVPPDAGPHDPAVWHLDAFGTSLTHSSANTVSAYVLDVRGFKTGRAHV